MAIDQNVREEMNSVLLDCERVSARRCKAEALLSTDTLIGGAQRAKIHQCGISRNCLTLKSWQCTFLSAVVAADWFRLDGSMET